MDSIQFEFQRLMAEQPVDETSVTGGDAFLPGLDVPEKKYKVGYTKDVKETEDKEPKLAAGKAKVYMKDKWKWKHAPSIPNRKSKGGFIYKQLFEEQDDFFINVTVRDARKALGILEDEFREEYKNKTIQLDGSNGYVINDLDVALDLYDAFRLAGVEIINHDVPTEDEEGLDEREITSDFNFKIGDEVKIPTKKTEFHGTVSGFTDDKVLVDITSGGGSTFKRPNMPFAPSILVKKDEEKSEEMPQPDKEELKEGLTREIKVRSEAQQFKEATRMVNKKLKEVNSILEYASQIKSNLSEGEANSSSKLMENMKKRVVEAYKKMKNL
jgi:hypothetical protein